MKTRTQLLLSLAVASVAIAGCTTIEQVLGIGGGGAGAKSGTCSPGQCQVWVAFNDTSSGCTVTDPGSLHVGEKNKVLITWHLQSGADFTEDGIRFKQGQDTVFTGNHRQTKGVYQVWDDYTKQSNAGTFHYKITIRTDTGHTCFIDPDVVNG